MNGWIAKPHGRKLTTCRQQKTPTRSYENGDKG
jgi:hypothetical protein